MGRRLIYLTLTIIFIGVILLILAGCGQGLLDDIKSKIEQDNTPSYPDFVKLLAPDAEAGANFGKSVSISGDYVIIGAWKDSTKGVEAGAAYIFHRTGANTWDNGTKIVSPDPSEYGWFGNSVSIDGDYAVVGAYFEDATGTDSGAAYVFHRIGENSWDSGTKLMGQDTAAGDEYGRSVSISGDYIVVGARKADAGAVNSGAAYIFHRTGTNTWDTGTKILPSNTYVDGYFGYSVSIDGDYAIVSASKDDTLLTDSGAAYIFRRTSTNSWSTPAAIFAPDEESNDVFGTSVSISGDYAIVGAEFEDTGGENAGASYIFHRTGTNTWDTGTKIMATDPRAGDWFGYSVSINGNYAIVGAMQEASGGTGAAYIFHRTGTNTWDTGTKMLATAPEASDYFGDSVSINGSYVIVGAQGEDSGGNEAGAAYIKILQ